MPDTVPNRGGIVQQRGGAVWLRVRAQPRASRTELAGEYEGALRVRLAAPPVEGEANRELTRFIAKLLHVSPSRVTVRSGEASRAKVLEIVGVDAEAVRVALGL